MKVKCIYNVPFPGDYFWGMCLYPFLLFKYPKDKVTREMFKHEWLHVEQVREMGWFKFHWKYFKELWEHGYHGPHPLEVEAYERMYEPLTEEEERVFRQGGE